MGGRSSGVAHRQRRRLVERGERVVVLDNLSTGYRSAVLGAPLVESVCVCYGGVVNGMVLRM